MFGFWFARKKKNKKNVIPLASLFRDAKWKKKCLVLVLIHMYLHRYFSLTSILLSVCVYQIGSYFGISKIDLKVKDFDSVKRKREREERVDRKEEDKRTCPSIGWLRKPCRNSRYEFLRSLSMSPGAFILRLTARLPSSGSLMVSEIRRNNNCTE